MLHAAVRSPQRRRLRGSAPRIPIALFQNKKTTHKERSREWQNNKTKPAARAQERPRPWPAAAARSPGAAGAARRRLEQFRSSRRCAGQGRNRQACKLPGEVRRDVQHGVRGVLKSRRAPLHRGINNSFVSSQRLRRIFKSRPVMLNRQGGREQTSQRKSGLPAIDRQGAGRGASERGGGGSLVGDTGVAP